jgi:hypothetical protein
MVDHDWQDVLIADDRNKNRDKIEPSKLSLEILGLATHVFFFSFR